MPGIGGIETLDALKERRPCPKVIILTGRGTLDSAIEGIRLSAFDYATKPIILDDLHKRMTQALQRKLL